MGRFLAKQPNGKYCLFSTVTDCPIHYNLTAEDYIELCKSEAVIRAVDTLDNHTVSFSKVVESFIPNNMNQKEFDNILKEMEV